MNLLAILLLFPQQVPPPNQTVGAEGISLLGALEAEMIALHQKLKPSLVKVRVRFLERGDGSNPKEREILLSGVVLLSNGLFVSPAIPVKGAETEVIRFDGHIFPAVPLVQSKDYGLALYRAKGLRLKAPELASCAGLQVGAVVVSLGNAFGLDGTLDVGYIAGVGRKINEAEGLLQLTNSINPGDGGGILADREGRIIGVLMTSLKEAALHEEGQEHEMMRRSESLSFAIPIDRVFSAFPDYFGMRMPPRPSLGIRVMQMPLEVDGEQPGFRLVVTEVLSDSPAQRAGVQEGDELVVLFGCALNDMSCLQRAITQTGKSAELLIRRGGEKIKLQIQLGSKKERD